MNTFFKPHRPSVLFAPVVLFALLFATSCSGPSRTQSNTLDAPHATNVILLIGDGMGLSQITAGMYAQGNTTALERMPVTGLVKTHSSNRLITDSAAGASAMACGKKTYNGAIAVDSTGEHMPTILEEANEKDFQTGLIATCTITHATPACFYAHDSSRQHYEAIALDFSMADVDLAIGYGQEQFNRRKDGVDLLERLENRGYEIHPDLVGVESPNNGPIAVILPGDPPVYNLRPDAFLENAVEFGLDRFRENNRPFFMMIEGAQIDWGGHANDANYIISEWKEFDRAVSLVMDYAEKDGNTLVIVTADHETGGFALNNGKLNGDSLETGFTTLHHSGTMVPVFAFGPGSGAFAGIQDNTDIYFKMRWALGWE